MMQSYSQYRVFLKGNSGSHCAFLIFRTGAAALLFSCAFAAVCSADRVAYQRAIEEVYYARTPTPQLTANIGSSYNNAKVPYSLDYIAILEAIGHCCSTNIWA